MVANTFEIALPGWVENDNDDNDGDSSADSLGVFEQDPTERSDPVIPVSSVSETPATSQGDEIGEEMMELELQLPPGEEQLWELLVERRTLLDDEDEETEIEEIEHNMEYVLPSSSTRTFLDRERESQTYVLKSALRSSCTAHLLQLVIKDGLKALKVCYNFQLINDHPKKGCILKFFVFELFRALQRLLLRKHQK